MEKKPRVGAGIPNTASCSPLSAPLSWHLETQPEQHQQVPFPLSCAGAALPGHSSVGRRVWAAAHVLAPAEPPWLAQQQVAVAVSPVMRMDVAHQAPLRELTQTLLFLWSAERRVFKLPYASRTPVLTQRSRASESNPILMQPAWKRCRRD